MGTAGARRRAMEARAARDGAAHGEGDGVAADDGLEATRPVALRRAAGVSAAGSVLSKPIATRSEALAEERRGRQRRWRAGVAERAAPLAGLDHVGLAVVVLVDGLGGAGDVELERGGV